MPTTTEIAIVTTPEGSTYDDPSSEHGKVWAKTRQTTSEQAGFQRSFWGRQIEDPNKLIWLIDWDSIDNHADFMNAPAYKEFFATAAPIFDMTNPPFLYHVNYTTGTPPSTPLGGPLTEIATFYLPASASAADKSAFESHVAKLGKACSTTTDSPAKSLTAGWAVEELDRPAGKSIAYSVLLAWESKEAHIAMTKTEAFHEAFEGGMGALPPNAPPDVFHAIFQS